LYADCLLELARIAADTNNVTGPKPNRRALEGACRQLCAYDKLFDDDDRKTRNYRRVAEIYAETCGLLKVDPGTCFPGPPAPVAAPAVPAPRPAPEPAPASGNGEPAAT
jgi:hypothetical protein